MDAKPFAKAHLLHGLLRNVGHQWKTAIDDDLVIMRHRHKPLHPALVCIARAGLRPARRGQDDILRPYAERHPLTLVRLPGRLHRGPEIILHAERCLVDNLSRGVKDDVFAELVARVSSSPGAQDAA